MTTTTNISTDNNTLTIDLSDGIHLEYSRKTDRRVVEAIDGKIFTKTLKGARELASEMRAWGVKEARALNYAVVFWS
jgi:hypothetical protein